MDIKYVQLGAKAREYFQYDGSSLPYRPLYTWEQDDAFEKSLVGASFSAIQLIMKIKLGTLASTDSIPLNSQQDVIEYQKHANLLDYWIVYHGIKDFQDPAFQSEDEESLPEGFKLIRTRFKYVHDIASAIMKITRPPDETIRHLVKSPKGQLLASGHYYMHEPLTSEQWQLTPLQHEFLVLSHPNMQAHEALEQGREQTAIKSGMSLKDVLQKLGVDEKVINKPKEKQTFKRLS